MKYDHAKTEVLFETTGRTAYSYTDQWSPDGKEVTYGYDGEIGFNNDDDTGLAALERIEIAEHMLQRWFDFLLLAVKDFQNDAPTNN